MANRVLNRPMFRMGGTPRHEFQEQTSGILSGLDGPKLNASRTGYENGGLTMEQFKKDVLEQADLRREILGEEDYKASAGMPGSASSALMNFGLNLLAQPGGNLFGSIGKAGAPVLRQFQSAREAERLDKRKAERDIKRDAFDSATDIFKSKIEADADIKSGAGKKGFEFKEKFDLIIQTQGEIQDLQGQLDIETDPKKKKQIQNSIASKQKGLENITEDDPFLAGFYKTEYFGDQIDQAAGELEVELGRPPTTKEIRDRVLGKKDGGRVPYQMGGEVMEEMSSVTEMGTPAPTAPAQTQDLTYDELRTRLPREITDDVVALIATSKQALLDFAEIQTQQDIDNFNQLYNVNLVLPQEG